MKCAACQSVIDVTGYIVTRQQDHRAALTVNLCGWCLNALVGATARNRLDRVLVKSGWVQPPLPEAG